MNEARLIGKSRVIFMDETGRKTLLALRGETSETKIKNHAWHGFIIFNNKGMGEIFHDQTKGFEFVCDFFHNINILVS